jgi:tryptophan halogenase
MELPETLAFKLDLWRRYGVLHEYDEEAFDATSWLAIHAGMDHWPERDDPVFAEISRERAASALRGRQNGIAAMVERMPLHHRTLERSIS